MEFYILDAPTSPESKISKILQTSTFAPHLSVNLLIWLSSLSHIWAGQAHHFSTFTLCKKGQGGRGSDWGILMRNAELLKWNFVIFWKIIRSQNYWYDSTCTQSWLIAEDMYSYLNYVWQTISQHILTLSPVFHGHCPLDSLDLKVRVLFLDRYGGIVGTLKDKNGVHKKCSEM